MLATELFIIPKLTFTLVQSIGDLVDKFTEGMEAAVAMVNQRKVEVVICDVVTMHKGTHHAENWRDFLVMAMETTDTTVQGYRCVAWLEELARVSMALLGGL